MTRPATILLSADGAAGRWWPTHAPRPRPRVGGSPSRLANDARTLAGAPSRRPDPAARRIRAVTPTRAVRSVVAAARSHEPAVHVVLVTSFAVGYGTAHPLNRDGGHRAAERALRASGLPWPIVRPTW